jgi:hypothetical protein
MSTSLARSQDGLLTRRQALQQLNEGELARKLGREWRVVLPGVYLTLPGDAPTLRQRRRAAVLSAGPSALLSDLDALDLYGLDGLPPDQFVRVVVPNDVQKASRDFLVIRRTKRYPPSRAARGLPVVPPDRALAEFILRHSDERASLAVASAALQRRLVDLDALAFEAAEGPSRGRPRLLRVLEKVGSGIRSVPESDLRDLVMRSRVLPEPLWNSLLRLPDGRVVSPDALFEDAGVVHETNGRRYHAAEDLFEDMQRRHDAMVAAGLVVLHNSPRRIAEEGRAVLAEIEACYLRHKGRGLPPGTELMRRTAA